MRLAAPVPLTGRYAIQGQQMAAGLKLWAHRSGADLSLEDDQSDPPHAVQIFQTFLSPTAGFPSPVRGGGSGRGPDIVLGPYGSDSVRALATSLPDTVIWNHGAAADDVQRMPNVISIPSPSSRYLVALARAAAQLRPGASAAIVIAKGRFADYAWTGLQAETHTLDLTIAGRLTFGDFSEFPSPLANNVPSPLPAEARVGVRGGRFDAVLTIGPVDREIALFRQLRKSNPDLLLGGVSPGLSAFSQALGADPEGFLAPVQWHPDLGQSPELGPTSAQVLEHARSLALGPLDYVAAQAYAAALIATSCHKRNPADPATAARELRTSTFFGDFELDRNTGLQRRHQFSAIQWRNGRQALVDVNLAAGGT